MKTQTVLIGLVLYILINQITCVIENFEFEYDDVPNDIDTDVVSSDYATFYRPLATKKPVHMYYAKYPMKSKSDSSPTVATTANSYYVQPKMIGTGKSNKNENAVHNKLTYHTVSVGKSGTGHRPRTNAIPSYHTISMSQAAHNKKAVAAVARSRQAATVNHATTINAVQSTNDLSYIGSPTQTYPYQQAFILNPSSMRVTQPDAYINSNSINSHPAYYATSELKSPNHMVQPIYIRLFESSPSTLSSASSSAQGNYLTTTLNHHQPMQISSYTYPQYDSQHHNWHTLN